jgi:hypothetical protein
MITYPSGWRAFAVDGVSLLPAFARHYWSKTLDLDRDAWRPGQNVARCLVDDHAAPDADCTCGIRVTAGWAGCSPAAPGLETPPEARANVSDMPDTQTYRILYTGTASFAGWVAQALREEGLDVSWTPPVEERGTVSDVVDNVTVALVVNGTSEAVRAAVAKARELLSGHGTVEVEDEDDQDGQKM